ncbi:uncharacterized protein LOC106643406 isoform X3 [Copidosoma floridanum]|uniref:uncharacterized protein LOC106643406 isoform X3 n=1 Tax=Copidosoma floridanum TaxID=29053 RepID=UPI0006C9C2F3|nr:uncharacterized protein LOC106643406 isoform X3 [Copidosoma floridanum]
MMLMLLLCVIMKIAEELTVDRAADTRPMPCCGQGRLRMRRKRRHKKRACGKTTSMMEDPQTPGSDCNSNPANESQDNLIGSEFIQDNTEYQWFIDYRDGGLHVHPSVLSSLSASYTKDDLGYYDDLARNLDANVAEVDMESFRTADIHTLLMCTDPTQHSEFEFDYPRERYASISGSVMEKLDISSSISPRGEDSACSTTDTISICKSSLLFSPVKEMPVLPPGGSYSVDSLDCEDMLITCQTNNKNNYTIAFEGSIAMYSDGSQDFDNQEGIGPLFADNKQSSKAHVGDNHHQNASYCDNNKALNNYKNMTLDLSMARSDSKIYTTWSNLKHSSIGKTISRHPSGNNNTTPNFLQSNISCTAGLSVTGAPICVDDVGASLDFLNNKSRCQSLPDLSKARELEHVEMVPLNFSVDSGEISSSRSGRMQSSSGSINEESSDSVGNTLSSNNKKLQNMSLVRLFMKQKSMSTEGMSLTLDQTDSGSETGWPASSHNSDSATNATQISRQQQQSIGPVTDNDLAIKWLKPENYGVDSRKKRFNKGSSNCSTSMEDLLSASATRSVSTSPAEPRNTQVDRNTTTNASIQVGTEVEDNSVQTSLIYPAPGERILAGRSPVRETLVNEKPVYVVYPNYALPDLSFLNSSYENVALKPHNISSQSSSSTSTGKGQHVRPAAPLGGRPYSCGDIDALRQRGFSHVKDWESLTFLLPAEYRRVVLHDLPEVPEHVKLLDEEMVRKPLFCLSPPVKHRHRHRYQQHRDVVINHHHHQNTATVVSSSSSTATQPSSGYRGSSTILTDSSSNQQNSSNPLYLYRYDSVSSEASLLGQEKLASRHSGGRAAPVLPKRSISLPQTNESANAASAPPRPPLPRSILRKNRAAAAAAAGKRCSMFEMGQLNEESGRTSRAGQESKRMSLQEPYYMNNDMQVLRHAAVVDSEKDIDEAEERLRFERMRVLEDEGLVSSGDDMRQLEEFLKRSGFSSHSSDADSDQDADLKLRSCVRRFLALRVNKDISKIIEGTDLQKKTVSFAVNGSHLDTTKQNIGMDDSKEHLNVSEYVDLNLEQRNLDLEEKKKLIWPVSKSVDALMNFWNSEPVRSRQGYNDKSECSQLCLGQLCPALYTIMSDGLKPHLGSTFGPIANSVWQVVEASSQQGPLTKTLNDLVQKINGEDFITEGMLKFHAFVFGLLNLRALDAWFAYLCTRESILRKHYNNSSLLVGALSCPNSRNLVEDFLNILQPLAFCPFQLDLLYQYRQLHNSFGQANAISHHQPHHLESAPITTTPTKSNKAQTRPMSCGGLLYCDARSQDQDEEVKRRWSQVPLGAAAAAKFHVFERLEDSDDYTDSLEHSPLNRASPRRNPPTKLQQQQPSKLADEKSRRDKANDDASVAVVSPGENKFRKLQEKWEHFGRDDVNTTAISPTNTTTTTIPSPKDPHAPASPSTPTRSAKSKIPRLLLTSPTKTPSNLPVPVKSAKSPSGIPSLKKPGVPKMSPAAKKSPEPRNNCKDSPRRTSRLDQENTGTPRPHLTRPSSLPYKTYGSSAKEKSTVSPHRRAASTSLPRPHSIAGPPRNLPLKQTPKSVRTLTSKPQSVDGHLSFNEGDKLKVILEVDGKWLLCARGERKGLVPRSCVKPCPT